MDLKEIIEKWEIRQILAINRKNDNSHDVRLIASTVEQTLKQVLEDLRSCESNQQSDNDNQQLQQGGVSVECEHPYAFVETRCMGEINQCLKCGKNL